MRVPDDLPGRVSVVGTRRMEHVMAQVPVAEGIFTFPSDDAAADRQPVRRVRHRHVPGAGLVPALRVDRDGRAPAGSARPALGVDDAGLPAAVAAVRGPDRQGLRAVRCRLRRASRRGEGGDAAHRVDPDALAIGMEMELTLVPFRTDDDGNEVVTFAFRPVSQRGSA